MLYNAVLVITACCLVGRSAAEKCTFPSQRVQCGVLACNETSGACVPCTSAEDCFEAALECVSGHCLLRSMTAFPLSQLLGCSAVVVAVCSIAVVAGLGGGGILVPLFSAILDVPIASAVAFSHSAISGQSLLNSVLAVRKTMPTSDGGRRPLINYQYLSILLPLCLAGTLLGSMLSKVVPDWLRLALLFVLLSAVLSKVVDRARRQFHSDKLRSQQATDEPKPQTPQELQGTEVESPVVIDGVTLPQYPVWELVIIWGSFFFLLFCNVARSEVATCGSATYIALVSFPVTVLLLFFWICRSRTRNLMNLIASGTLSPDHLTFQWNDATTVYFPLIAILAGGAASMLGIGGGLVLSFVLFEAGLTPEEASATSGFATMVIATESGLQLMLQRQLPISFALWFVVSGFLSTVLGSFGFMRYIRRVQKPFLIVAALGVIVGGSLICLTSYGIYDAVIVMKHDGSLFSFGHFCKTV